MIYIKKKLSSALPQLNLLVPDCLMWFDRSVAHLIAKIWPNLVYGKGVKRRVHRIFEDFFWYISDPLYTTECVPNLFFTSRFM